MESKGLSKQSPWSEKRGYDQLHSLCSYLGSYPPSLANYFIKYFTDPGDLVLDPFSGRGTTILESRLNKRRSVGSDLNPIAVILSKAKSFKINKKKVFERIDDLENNFDRALYFPVADSVEERIKLIFHKSTITELCYLKSKLKPNENDIDSFISGAILGILHGGERKDGSSAYLSISMPNTFSMSPDYVRRYIQKNKLNRDYRNTFVVLRNKIERTLSKHNSPGLGSDIFRCDAKKISTDKKIKRYLKKVKLVLTSPPYLGIVNYEKQNWIRSWFAKDNYNKTKVNLDAHLDDNLNLNEWLRFSKTVVEQIKRTLTKDGVAVFVIGDVKKSQDSIILLARDFVSMISQNRLFKNIWVYSDHINKESKTTRIWGETKGTATAVDRIVIMSDSNPFVNNKRIKSGHIITHKEIVKCTKDFMGK